MKQDGPFKIECCTRHGYEYLDACEECVREAQRKARAELACTLSHRAQIVGEAKPLILAVEPQRKSEIVTSFGADAEGEELGSVFVGLAWTLILLTGSAFTCFLVGYTYNYVKSLFVR